MSKAVYAGSFDPITKGHLWMIRQGVGLFDEFVVAVGVNPDKSSTFSTEDRLAMLRASLDDLPNITIDWFELRYLVDYASSIGARYILRGIRDLSDYQYEQTMRHINADMAPQITTVFLMPPRELAELSSSFVKGLVGPFGWRKVVKQYVPPAVFEAFLERYGG